MGEQKQSVVNRKLNGQRGVAIIVAVAICVAVIMLAAALLGTVKRSSSAAAVYKTNDILQLALASAKADAIQTIIPDLPNSFNEIKGVAFIYNFDRRGEESGWWDAEKFKDEYKALEDSARDREFFADDHGAEKVSAFDLMMRLTDDNEHFAVKTRTFVIPLDAAFLVNYVQKFYENGAYTYPFPRLFDTEAALVKNVVPLYTDIYAGYDAREVSKGDVYQNESSLDDYIRRVVGGSSAQFTDDAVAHNGDYKENAVKYIVLSGDQSALAARIYDKIQNGAPAYFKLEENLSTYTKDANGKYVLVKEQEPYRGLLDNFIGLAELANDETVADRIDFARLVMNYGQYAKQTVDTTNLFNVEQLYSYDTKLSPTADLRVKKLKNVSNYGNETVKKRGSFSSFNEFGLTVATFTQTDKEKLGVFLGSVPYNTTQFVDEAILKKDEADKPLIVKDVNGRDTKIPAKIPLNATTPKWLIAAAVGWQLFNSPAASDRRSKQIQDNYQGGTIYRIDYTANEDLAFVFDPRRLIRSNSATSGNDFTPTTSADTGELVVTPYSSKIKNATGSLTEVASPGFGHYYAYPLRYIGALVGCRAFWSGWGKTDNLDLLAFATGKYGQFTNSYEVNFASPFAVGDYAIDVRTENFAGTGTFVRPSIDEATGSKGDRTAVETPEYDIWRYGRVAIYGNTLRTHNELARIIDIIDENKDAAQLKFISDDPVLGDTTGKYRIDNNPAKGFDPIKVIIGKIYTDPQVGYRDGVVAVRSVISKNPHEGTAIWGRNPSAPPGSDPVLVGMTTDSTSLSTTSRVWTSIPSGNKTEMVRPKRFLLVDKPLAWYPQTRGSGVTADRSIETLMEGTGARGSGPNPPNPNPNSLALKDPAPSNWGEEYAKYAVDNFARDWDGRIMDARSSSSTLVDPKYAAEPTLYFDKHFNLDSEMKFSDSYFNTDPGNYAAVGALLDGSKPFRADAASGPKLSTSGAANGSSFQGMDTKMDGTSNYAEPLLYRDNLVHFAQSSLATSVNEKLNLRGSPVIYCDQDKDDDNLGLISGKMNDGAGVTKTNKRMVEISAPPYQHSYGRVDLRRNSTDVGTAIKGSVGSNGNAIDKDAAGSQAYYYGKSSDIYVLDLPGYRIAGGNLQDKTAFAAVGVYADSVGKEITVGTNGSVSSKNFTIPSGVVALDISRQGTLYQNDALKLTSLWRWNWGRWTQVQHPDAGTKTGVYTFVPDPASVGRRKIVPTAWSTSEGSAANAPFVMTTTSATGQEVLGWRAFKYIDTVGGRNRVFLAPHRSVDHNTTSVIHQKGVYMVRKNFTPDSSKKLSASATKIDTSYATEKQSASAGLYECDSDGYNCVQIDVFAAANSPDLEVAYVGRFAKRVAKIHRWKPAAGSVVPYYIEVNPQAVKNATIERVVVNLFGYPEELQEVIKVNYLVNTAAGTSDPKVRAEYIANQLREKKDIGDTTVFHWKPTDSFYRVIVSAGFVNSVSQKLISHQLLQFVYRQNSDGSGEVVDQHYLDAE